MKKFFSLLALCFLLCLGGCSNPDSLQLDLFEGYGNHLRLLHLNASTQERKERIEAFSRVFEDAQPLSKSIEMFAYYPDYVLTITPWKEQKSLEAVVDVNGDYVDFYYSDSAAPPVLYRSKMSAEEFLILVNQV